MQDQEFARPADGGAVRDALTKDERAELVTLTLADEIRREMDAAETAWSDAVGHAIRAGELLMEAKDQLKHGEWCPGSRRTSPAPSATRRTSCAWPEIRNA